MESVLSLSERLETSDREARSAANIVIWSDVFLAGW